MWLLAMQECLAAEASATAARGLSASYQAASTDKAMELGGEEAAIQWHDDDARHSRRPLRYLDGLDIAYDARWPMSMLLTPELLDTYDAAFGLLAKVRWVPGVDC